jgi:hypothetical protein
MDKYGELLFFITIVVCIFSFLCFSQCSNQEIYSMKERILKLEVKMAILGEKK